jgi:hypothetical protein
MSENNERLAGLVERHRALQEIIEARAAAYGDDPVGSSGLYNRRFRIHGSEFPVLVVEYWRDPGELRLFLKIEKHMAIEMGRKRKSDEEGLHLAEMRRNLEAGRQRVADSRQRYELAARAKGETGTLPPSSDVGVP